MSGRVRGLRQSPYAAGFRAELESRGYAPVPGQHRLSQFGQISRWLDAERLEHLLARWLVMWALGLSDSRPWWVSTRTSMP
jgi:hypothetical protein